MASPPSSAPPKSMISDLERARRIVLDDPTHYSQIVPGVLGLIGPSADLPIRRWGSAFLAEALAYPKIDPSQREKLALTVLPILKEFLDNPHQDAIVTKFAILTASTIYPLVFKHLVYNPSEHVVWEQLQALRSDIVQRMDISSTDVRVCCYKFVVRVVQTQTMGLIADPRRPDLNETSLALVPPNHPLLIKDNIRPLTQGLFDRVLGIFQETTHNAFLVDATLMSVGSLGDARPELLEKIIKVVLTFNPFDNAEFPMAPRDKVLLVSMYRTLRAFLTSFTKRHDKHPMIGAVHHHLHTLEESRKRTFDPNIRKRAATGPQTNELNELKRQRANEETPPVPTTQPQTVSLADVWTVTDNPVLRNVDANAKINGQNLFAFRDVWNLVLTTFVNVDQNTLDARVNTVRQRWLQLKQQGNNAPSAATAGTSGTAAPTYDEDDEDEEYEPEDNIEQMANRVNQGVVSSVAEEQIPMMPIKPFALPKPAPLSPEERLELSKRMHERLFAFAENMPDRTPGPRRIRDWQTDIPILESKQDWFAFIARLINRGRLGREPPLDPATGEETWPNPHGDALRERFLTWILVDFRERWQIGKLWFNEELWMDHLRAEKLEEGIPAKYCGKWVLRLFDGFAPFLDGTKDKKMLTRFLSEIAGLPDEVFPRVIKLAEDPERVTMVVYALHYLIEFRTPVKSLCLDGLEELYRHNTDARAPALKVLKRLAPERLDDEDKPPISNFETQAPQKLQHLNSKAAWQRFNEFSKRFSNTPLVKSENQN